MATLDELLEAYDQDHRHPQNRMLHVVGITLIASSVPLVLVAPKLALGSFALGWTCQLVGHAIEGKKPSFSRDPRFMAVGAVWYVQRLRELVRSPAPAPRA
jgi:uncharacterized membrane protein YGL010W